MIRKNVSDSTRYFLRLNDILQGHIIPLNVLIEKFKSFYSCILKHKYSVLWLESKTFQLFVFKYLCITTHSIYLLLLNLPLHVLANRNDEKTGRLLLHWLNVTSRMYGIPKQNKNAIWKVVPKMIFDYEVQRETW